MGCTRTNLRINKSPRFSILTEDQKETIFHAVLRTLRYTGINVHHEGARKLLEENGCIVDDVRVYFPQELVQKALSTAPRYSEIFAWDGDSSRNIRIEKGRSHFGPGPTPPFFVDPYTLERRKFMRKDAPMVACVQDALPNITYTQCLGTISDVTDELADVYEFADSIRNTTKPFMGWAFNRHGLRDQYRIAVAMAGGEDAFRKRPNFVYYGEPISPLMSDFDAMDKCMFAAENRIPQVYTPCTIGGATAPATHAAQITTGLSEGMVGVVVSQIINPGTTIIVGGVHSILDMRHSIYSYGAPELSLMSAALTEMAHYCGLPMYSTSGCTDAKVMEIQSGMEAALSINAAMMSGADFVHDNSYIESGKCADIMQTVMDDEIIGMAEVIKGGIDVSPEALAQDVIVNVGGGGHYLYEDHTMEWFRNHYNPTLMERRSYEDWAVDQKTMKDRIIDKTRNLIENYEGPRSKVPAKADEEIEHILGEAEERVAKNRSK